MIGFWGALLSSIDFFFFKTFFPGETTLFFVLSFLIVLTIFFFLLTTFFIIFRPCHTCLHNERCLLHQSLRWQFLKPRDRRDPLPYDAWHGGGHCARPPLLHPILNLLFLSLPYL